MAAKVGFQVKNAKIRMGCAEMAQQELAHQNEEQGEISGIGHRRLVGVHKVFQAPELFGITKIEFDLETQAVVVDQLVISQFEVTTK